MPFTLKLRSNERVTHDTYRLVFDRPEGFDFEPGQATDMALDRDGWREETRPFTMTSQPEDPQLEFVIKSYPSHEGVTNEIATLVPGELVMAGRPWGAIHDAGPGVFIAGGAGITPFIPILRRRSRDGTLGGSTLIFANRTPDDIILREEWDAMEGLNTVYVVDTDHPRLPRGPVDADLLDRHITDFSGQFYLCGPPEMADAVRAALHDNGVSDMQIVTEDKPDEEKRAELFAA